MTKRTLRLDIQNPIIEQPEVYRTLIIIQEPGLFRCEAYTLGAGDMGDGILYGFGGTPAHAEMSALSQFGFRELAEERQYQLAYSEFMGLHYGRASRLPLGKRFL